MKRLLIGDLARHVGVPVSTVRYYERKGLLEPPQRRESGYREYSQASIERLRFIRQAQELGFTLQRIRTLAEIRSNPDARLSDVRCEAEESLADIRRKIATLTEMESSLAELLAGCSGDGPLMNCPIINTLDSPNGENHETND